MLRFSRSEKPPPEKKPRIVDGPQAKVWLAGMAYPLSQENLAEIAQVLHALGAAGVQDGDAPGATAASKLAPVGSFAVAERIRGPLSHALGDRSRDDTFATLPIDDDYALRFWAAVDAAAALRDVYVWLVSQLPEAPAPGGPGDVPDSTSLVSRVGALHRALDVNAHILLAIQRARWPVPARFWERHCALGQLVRDLDCQDIEVADVLRASTTRTCRAAFVLPVLIGLADPAARSAAEFEVVRMAAQRWSARVGFRIERRTDALDGRASPARPVANPGPSVTLGGYVLRFDTQAAMQSLERRLEALAEGKTPREVGIGDTLRPPVARELLLTLRQRWGAVSPAEVDSPDRSWRAVSPPLAVLAVVGLPMREAAMRDADGSPGQSPYAYQRMKQGAITRPREAIEKDRIDQLLAQAETWTLTAESADALRCVRKHARPRLGLQRLIALKLGARDDDVPLLVGWVEALQGSTIAHDERVRHSGAHTVRVRLAPGLPQLVRASIDEVELDCAFLLVPGGGADGTVRTDGVVPSFVPLNSESGLKVDQPAIDGDGWQSVRTSPRDYGLILPHATFRPQRLIRVVRQGVLAVLRLEELLMRGSDFDLVRFTPL